MAVTTIPIEWLQVAAYTIPTDFPESDGTLEWDSTTLVLVKAGAGGKTGIGFTYADTATGRLIQDRLAALVVGRDAMAVTESWNAMVAAIRNLGRPGICSMAIAAVDTALWDLKAKLLELPLVTLLGAAHEAIAVYGSGGFTSYPVAKLQEQLGGWTAGGISRVKMKVGRSPEEDVERVRVGALCDAFQVSLSAHCAPALHSASLLRSDPGAASRILS